MESRQAKETTRSVLHGGVPSNEPQAAGCQDKAGRITLSLGEHRHLPRTVGHT